MRGKRQTSRSVIWPLPIRIWVGHDWIAANAYGIRMGRRGRQVLVGHGGRLVWIPVDRVQMPTRTPTEPALGT